MARIPSESGPPIRDVVDSKHHPGMRGDAARLTLNRILDRLTDETVFGVQSTEAAP